MSDNFGVTRPPPPPNVPPICLGRGGKRRWWWQWWCAVPPVYWEDGAPHHYPLGSVAKLPLPIYADNCARYIDNATQHPNPLDNMSGVQRLRAAVHAGNTTALVELCLHLQDQVDSLNTAMTKVTGPEAWNTSPVQTQQYPSASNSPAGKKSSP